METAPHGRESAEQTPERPGAPTDPQTGSGGLPGTHHEAATDEGPADFVFATLIANHPDPTTASRALAKAQANALRVAATDLEASALGESLVYAAARLRRSADNVEVKAALSHPATSAPDFFQPGHSYLYAQMQWKFRCDAVTSHPHTGKRVALGYSGFGPSDWQTSDLSEGVWADGDWTDIAEARRAPEPQHYDKTPDPADGCHWCVCGNRWPCKDATAPTEAYPVGGENAQETTV